MFPLMAILMACISCMLAVGFTFIYMLLEAQENHQSSQYIQMASLLIAFSVATILQIVMTCTIRCYVEEIRLLRKLKKRKHYKKTVKAEKKEQDEQQYY
jgi:flagellar biosynthesis protein FliP